MSEINSAGYEDLRNYVFANWKTVKLLDSNSSEVLSLTAGVDSEISMQKNDSKILYTISFTGQKIDNLPKTIAMVGVYKGENEVVRETLSAPLTIQTGDDVVFITLELSIPNLGGAM